MLLDDRCAASDYNKESDRISEGFCLVFYSLESGLFALSKKNKWKSQPFWVSMTK